MNSYVKYWRLHAGRLARDRPVDRQLRPPSRARNRPRRGRQPARGWLRQDRRQPAERHHSRWDRSAQPDCQPAGRRRPDLRGPERCRRDHRRCAGRGSRPARVAYSINPKTVVRGGYGLFWAPWAYGANNSVGFSSTTNLQQDTTIPITSVDNPFPTGFLPISGNQLGLASGAAPRSASSIRTRPRHACSSARSTSSASWWAT